jgi:protoporphyrin/coproporphyrin ferrochelatase
MDDTTRFAQDNEPAAASDGSGIDRRASPPLAGIEASSMPAEVTPAVIADAITRMMGRADAGLPPPIAANGGGPVATVASRCIGVLLVNLGTPERADAKAVRVYLKEFLADRRVIEEDSLLWWLALNAVILPLRPRIKARDYRKIWNRERNESPLKTITRSQAQKLAAALTGVDTRIVVDWAMRYGQPSIRARLDTLRAQGCDRILIMPLYPQYCAATTATVADEAFRALMDMRFQPAIRIAPAYHDEPGYIDALAGSLQAELAKLDFVPEVIVASFHGIPQDYVRKGDPYEGQCLRTTALIRERLGYTEKQLMLTFQSRFGRAEWLKPYTIDTMQVLAERGVKKLAVITPGFSADCLETLEEIAVENAAVFKRGGGEKFAAVPCLNDSEPGMRLIQQLVLRELKGWV